MNTSTVMRHIIVYVASTIAISAALSAHAQDQPQDQPQDQTPTNVEAIVVTAKRIEAPIWRVESDSGALILVGTIDGLPRDFEWRTDALTSIVSEADRVLFPFTLNASLVDVGKLIWRAPPALRLPEGTTAADYLPAEDQLRLERVQGETRRSRRGLRSIARDLMEGVGLDRRGRPVNDIVRQTARRGRIPARPVGEMSGRELVDRLTIQKPEDELPCLQAAITAAEAGPSVGPKRADDWKRRKVAEVMASPLSIAAQKCSLWEIAGYSSRLTDAWDQAIEESLASPGSTVALAPLHLLAAPNGVLDRLDQRGLDVSGPPWRAPTD